MARDMHLIRRSLGMIGGEYASISGGPWRIAAVFLALAFVCPAAYAASGYFVYITSGQDGLYVSSFDPDTGEIADPAAAAPKVERMNFHEIHPNGKYLYACVRTRRPDESMGGALIAYAIDLQDGKLTKLNETDTREGPAHVAVDATGSVVIASNYSGGSIAAAPIRPDGSLADLSAFIKCEGSSVHPKRQTEPHPHAANFSVDNRCVVIADLGQDKLLVYRVDPAKGTLTPNDPPFFSTAPGTGPRHMTFHPNGKWAYVINELVSTVSALAYDADRGVFEELQTISTLPETFSDSNTTAEVLLHPSGRFLYGSNRGHDSIAVFLVDEDSGQLTPIEHVSTQGQRPRNFRLDPEGRYLFAANQDSDTVVIFGIDGATGRLTPMGRTLVVPRPMCVRFVKRN